VGVCLYEAKSAIKKKTNSFCVLLMFILSLLSLSLSSLFFLLLPLYSIKSHGRVRRGIAHHKNMFILQPFQSRSSCNHLTTATVVVAEVMTTGRSCWGGGGDVNGMNFHKSRRRTMVLIELHWIGWSNIQWNYFICKFKLLQFHFN
jgi:hypothetical protein